MSVIFTTCNCKSHPNKLLKEHINEVKKLFRELVDFYEIDEKKDITYLFESLIELHDIGKCKEEFQEYIKDLEKGIYRKPPGSHSLWTLEKIFEKKEYRKLEEFFPILYLLIAKHHSNLTLAFRKETENILRKLLLEHYGIFLKELVTKGKGKNEIIESYKDLIKRIKNGDIRAFYKKYLRKVDKNTLLTIADLFGLFKIADSLSAQNDIEKIKDICSTEKITENKVKALINNNFDEKRWGIQRELSKYNYLILRAPTGWGKTTVSLLFALNKNYKRILITLPTITAIESFYRKLKQNFKAEMYFYFYDAYLTLENEIDEKIRTLLYIQNLYSPINITTIDQIFLSFLQAGKYFLKRVNLRKSILILDEVHLLTPQMLFILKKLIDHLASLYKIKLLLMSATLPRGIVEYLSENLKFETIDIYGLWNKKYFDKKYYERERFEFEPIKKDILDDLERIVEENKKGKSVLVIVNTVEKAVTVYKKLRQEYRINNILLLHGRFMYKHRRKKEENIRCVEKFKGIFVSTQVAEVSLDIDFDILFTELAPISPLIQRAGRVNRYGKKQKAKVYVYYPREIEELDEDGRKKYPYNVDEMDRTWHFLNNLKSCKEGELIRKIDEKFTKDFYEELIKNTEIYNLYKEVFEDRDIDYNVQWFLSSTSKEDKAKELLNFRNNITTLVIPYGNLVTEEDVYKEINNLIEYYKHLKQKQIKVSYEDWKKFFAEVKLYAVPIPIWILTRLEIEDKYGFPILEKLSKGLNYKYFKEYGLINLDKIEKYDKNVRHSFFNTNSHLIL